MLLQDANPTPSFGGFGFSVTDNGIGMSPEQMERVFEAFRQADQEITRQYGGTGLGLPISRSFCQMMGGDLTAESQEGKGSTFTIALPATVAEPARDGDDLSVPAGTIAASSGTVLVIDDDPDARDMTRRFLTKEGFNVVSASGGQEGLRLAREVGPDVITLDVLMPSMDGWSVLSSLKSDPKTADIPVVVLTIVDDDNMGYVLGASDFLKKPIDRDQLISVLNKYRKDHLPGSVLVVEDEVETRTLMRRTLEKEGWSVAEAENGRVGLERLEEGLPGAIILDLLMPEMDGFEFVSEIGRHQEWRSVPIIVVTAKDVSEEDRRKLSGSVEKILQKGANTRRQIVEEIRGLVNANAPPST